MELRAVGRPEHEQCRRLPRGRAPDAAAVAPIPREPSLHVRHTAGDAGHRCDRARDALRGAARDPDGMWGVQRHHLRRGRRPGDASRCRASAACRPRPRCLLRRDGVGHHPLRAGGAILDAWPDAWLAGRMARAGNRLARLLPPRVPLGCAPAVRRRQTSRGRCRRGSALAGAGPSVAPPLCVRAVRDRLHRLHDLRDRPAARGGNGCRGRHDVLHRARTLDRCLGRGLVGVAHARPRWGRVRLRLWRAECGRPASRALDVVCGDLRLGHPLRRDVPRCRDVDDLIRAAQPATGTVAHRDQRLHDCIRGRADRRADRDGTGR